MSNLLKLVLYILAATGLGWLVLWGSGQVGIPHTAGLIAAGIVFVVVLIYGMKQTGTADI